MLKDHSGLCVLHRLFRYPACVRIRIVMAAVVTCARGGGVVGLMASQLFGSAPCVCPLTETTLFPE